MRLSRLEVGLDLCEPIVPLGLDDLCSDLYYAWLRSRNESGAG